MSRLLEQRGTVLKMRQELPERAFVPASELRKVWDASGQGGVYDQVAPVITILFCWDTPKHPDPEGKQLRLVVDTLRREYHTKYSFVNGSFMGFSEMGVL